MAVKLPIYVVSMGRRSQTALKLHQANVPFTLVTHTPKMLNDFIDLCGFAPTNALVTNRKGLLSSRNAIMEMTPDNSWYFCLDDDINTVTRVDPKYRGEFKLEVTGPPPPGFKSWREVYKRPISMKELVDAAQGVIAECKRQDTVMGGFATMENPYFRARRWGRIRGVGIAAFVFQKRRGGIDRFKYPCMQDQWMSMNVIREHGSVVVDNFVHVGADMFTPGGIGVFEERMPEMQRIQRLIIEEFEGLAKPSSVCPNIHYISRSRTFVDRWRARQGERKQ
jgi:hypothetical protein